MTQLLSVPADDRDLNWERQFLSILPLQHCEVLSPEPQMGPDGWPYLLIKIGQEKASEPVAKVLQWLGERGIGLVVNPEQAYPDYVLSYGMIWSYIQRGNFAEISEAITDASAQPVEINSSVFVGEPTPEVLPAGVRKIMREFFRDQGILRPRILGVSPDGKKFELALSLESLGEPPEKEHPGIAEAISWFLAPDYPVILMSEKTHPGFVDL